MLLLMHLLSLFSNIDFEKVLQLRNLTLKPFVTLFNFGSYFLSNCAMENIINKNNKIHRRQASRNKGIRRTLSNIIAVYFS